jgi:AMMECR1 domain-containing protein
VFLPQAAPEQGWDLTTTLRQLSRKAGLPADAWQSGRLYRFTAEIIDAAQTGP